MEAFRDDVSKAKKELTEARNRLYWQNTILDVSTIVFQKVFSKSSFNRPPTRSELKMCRNAASLYVETSRIVASSISELFTSQK